MQRGNDVLLEMGKLMQRTLRSQVTAGHHDRSRRENDPVEVLDRCLGLDLGHDQRAARRWFGSYPAHIVRGPHKTESDHVDPDADEGIQHTKVLSGGSRNLQPLRRDVQAWLADDGPAVLDPHLQHVQGGTDDPEHHRSVSDDESVALENIVEECVVVDRKHLVGARSVTG